MKDQIPYGKFTLKDLENLLEELSKKNPKRMDEVFLINEGNGYIPFNQSKTFDKAFKEHVKKLK